MSPAQVDRMNNQNIYYDASISYSKRQILLIIRLDAKFVVALAASSRKRGGGGGGAV